MAKEYSKSDMAALLAESEQEREKLAKERNAIAAKITHYDMVIESLRNLMAPLPAEPPIVAEVAVAMLKYAGLTDVVRMTLQASGHQGHITITQIVDKLKSIAYPLDRLDNPRASIVVVLSRMVSAGDVEKKDIGRPEPAFRWVGMSARMTKAFLDVVTVPPVPAPRLGGLGLPSRRSKK